MGSVLRPRALRRDQSHGVGVPNLWHPLCLWLLEGGSPFLKLDALGSSLGRAPQHVDGGARLGLDTHMGQAMLAAGGFLDLRLAIPVWVSILTLARVIRDCDSIWLERANWSVRLQGRE